MRPAAELDLPLAVDRRAATPLHAQLAAGLRQAALTGLLPAGSRLPPTRLLAARLGLARSTVLAAYEQLDGEGFLAGRHGSGTYLSTDLPTDRAASPTGRPTSTPAAACAQTLPAGSGHRQVVDLRPGRPSTRRLPDPAWTRAWRAVARTVLSREPPLQGLLQLREELAAHLRAARGLHVAAADVFVTAGTNEGLSLLTSALGLSGEAVAVEDPGYPAARRVLTRHGCTLVPVPVDDDGLLVDALPRGPGAPRAVLVTPSHQYPLGGRLPIDRRLALLEWAGSTGAVVAEDDYDSEFRFDVAPLPALAGLDRTGLVVHLGTFSKVLSPWLRAGYLVAPPDLSPALLAVRADLGSPVSGVEQQALATYLAAGGLRRHIARSRRDYAHVRAHLKRLLAPHPGTLRLRGLAAGLHAVVDLPDGTDTGTVLHRLREHGVLLADLAEYAVQPARPARPALVLGYADATLGEVDRAVRALLDAVGRRGERRPPGP